MQKRSYLKSNKQPVIVPITHGFAQAKPNYALRRIVTALVLIGLGLALYAWSNTPDPGPCHFEGSVCVYEVSNR